MWLNRPKSQLTATKVRIPDSETYVFTFFSSNTNITFQNLHFSDKSTFIIYHVTFIALSKKSPMSKKHFINTNFEWNTPIDQKAEFVHRDIFLNSISEFFVGNLMSVSSLKIYISNLWLKFYLCYQKWQYQGVKSSAMLKTTSSKNMGIVLHA